MHPEVSEIIARRRGLRQFILVMRKTQIQPAAVNIEPLPQIFTRHRRAFQMPAGTTAAPRRIPRCGQRFAFLIPLPQGKIAGITLAARVCVGGILHIVYTLAGERAILFPRTHIEVDIPRIVKRRVCVPAVDEALNKFKHLRNVTGRARLIGWRVNTQRRICARKNFLVSIRERPPLLVGVFPSVGGLCRFNGLRQNFIVNIRNIAHGGDFEPAVAHPPRKLVEDQGGTDMPHMRFTLHGGTAVVDACLAGDYRFKIADA